LDKEIDVEKLKAVVVEEIDTRRHQLSELSLKIHSNPELGFHEVKAALVQTTEIDAVGINFATDIDL